ncbi:hypothetical protein DSAG12_00115 [Promethearchaeum syntrophicum]|uniref:TFIIB-type zinc ribbon-containing protein n=1 Tax=Promethearchaeum syntrophicum TaxID=2594042 RepID=A0A5B9D5Q0_9ARCH|nr:hypothetical protein [Candidatus Prometheoarchaeum syntrophicum]QEE14303.1 hypothetical protein DSAG12_00115 [Candidatus Prometheoarchaeum syntrophicum]
MGRCSSCGAESDLDEYVCSNCGYHIKTERIEGIPFLSYLFKRPEKKWYKPDKILMRIAKTIYNPAWAFFDINKKKKSGTILILLINALFFGLWGVAINIHVTVAEMPFLQKFLNGLAIFLVLFIFSILYYSIIFWVYDLSFSLASNFSVQLDGILAIRFNIQTKKGSLKELMSGKKRLQRQISEDTIKLEGAKQKKPLKKIKQTGKYKIMRYAYTPLIVINFVGFLLLLVALPTRDNTQIADLFSSPVWTIIYLLEALTLILWIPVLVTLALREIGNTNTTKLLIGNVVIGVILSFLLILLRPDIGAGDLNLIALFQGATS